jgi:4-hydroxy-2-oxoheptanedioate aldolase
MTDLRPTVRGGFDRTRAVWEYARINKGNGMKIEAVRAFKSRLVREPVFGPFSKTCDPAMIEAMGHAGFDFVILDMEHGPNGLETLQNLIRAAELSNLLPIVRTRPGNTELIGMALDIGAAGVQAPQVTTPREAAAAVAAAKFSPQGERGVCRYVRAANYSSIPAAEYFPLANEALLIVQLEGKQALDNLDAILDVPGLDVIFVGPYDLSQSLGVPGQVNHPRVVECVKRIVKACKDRKLACGTFTESPATAASWVAQGLHYVSYSVDVGLMTAACAGHVRELKAACKGA